MNKTQSTLAALEAKLNRLYEAVEEPSEDEDIGIFDFHHFTSKDAQDPLRHRI